MSDQVNTNIIEQALEWAERWAGTSLGDQLLAEYNATKNGGNLDHLTELINQARTDWYDLEERTLEYDEVI